MKKILFLTLVLILGFSACRNASVDETSNNDSTVSTGGKKIDNEADNPAENLSDSNNAGENSNQVDETAGQANDSGGGKNADGVESIYTDLAAEKCKTIESDDEGGGWSVQECPGIEGYKLQVTEGDLRQSINVIAPSGGKYELNFTGNVSAAFSAVGDKAEWRVKKVDGKTVPIALIVRFNANEDPENPDKVTSYLTVTKFDGEFICMTDVVKPVKNANVKARELADTAKSKPCLKGNG